MAQAVDRINDNLKIMPETKAWSGQAHDAASEMFDRARTTTTRFREYTTAIGKALTDGADRIGGTRIALLNKADEVDQGELHVTDAWVVLIKPAAMSAEKVAELLDRVAVEQAAINGLLLTVGEADDETAANLAAAAQPFGYVTPKSDGLGGMMIPGVTKPGDDVPNPRDHIGLFQQATIRGEDMGMHVREVEEEIVNDDEFRKTLTMQDGSKHVIWEYGGPLVPKVTDTHYDADGNMISSTTSWTNPIGDVKHIDIEWADGTVFNATETPNGHRTAAFTLPDGRHGVLPPDNPLFTGAFPTTVGNTLTGLEAHLDRGGKLPMVSMDAAEKVKAGAKFGGPALGILTTIYDMGSAATPYERCVAGLAGGFGVVGDVVGSAGGAAAGTIAPPGAQAFTVPFFAVTGSVVLGDWMKDVGAKVGGTFCK
ncbi:MAG: hypothetical protein M3Y83_18650 [Actinomycetota bacterium]|nr:hypothetical protein [Actinomycetota bacterium]